MKSLVAPVVKQTEQEVKQQKVKVAVKPKVAPVYKVACGVEMREYRNDADLFLLSANAVTKDGRIVNIDGRGNRVAASICGPRRVVYVIGRNKIVDGGLDEAVSRIKKYACAPNCRRLGKMTPCAATGVCADCDSPDRICKVMAVFDRRPTGISALALLVDADLGY